MKYIFHSTILKIEEKSRVVRAWKDGDDVKTDMENLGWYILLEGSREGLFVGLEKPEFMVGQRVTVTIA
jgi:hypothetical protein